MKIKVAYQYPEQIPATVEVPEEIVLHPEYKSLQFAFNTYVPGIKALEVFQRNIHYLMVEKGLITKDAKILSVEIFPN